MTATELRIGNWIEYEGKYQKIYAMSNGTEHIDPAVAFFEGLDGPAWNDVSKCQPIQLTINMLLALGFKEQSDGTTYSLQVGNTSYLEYIESEGFAVNPETWRGSSCLMWNNIYHLHQLQNLYYSLTGEELTINL